MHLYPSGCRLGNSRNHFQERALARTVLPDDTERQSLLDRETDIIQCRDRWVNLWNSGEGAMLRSATHCIFYEGTGGGLRYSQFNPLVPNMYFGNCTMYDTDGNQFLWFMVIC